MPFRQNAAPPPPPSTGDAERMLAAELRRKRLRLGAIIGFIAFACTAPILYAGYRSARESMWRRAEQKKLELTEQEEHELAGSIQAAQASLSARDEKWADATAMSALAGIGPGARWCPTAPSAPARTAGDSYEYFAGAGYTVRDKEDAPGGDPEAASVRQRLARLSTEKKAKRDDLDFVRSVLSGSYFVGKRTVVVIADDRHTATVVGAGLTLSYAGGTLTGRAYQYDHAKQKVVCAGDIDVRNSSEVDIHYLGRGYGDESAQRTALERALERDLALEARRAIAEELRTAELAQ